MVGGYMGRLLFADLNMAALHEEALDERLARDFLGGYGLGARILYSRQRGGVDPLGPENTLGFLTGPLTGTPALGGSRFVVVGKSPLTGTWGDANCGGYFGPHLKFAGFDGVFFTGIASKPVYLLIEDGAARLCDAGALWGLDSTETDDALKAAHGKEAQVACIGPAGEKGSLIAGVMHDKGRAAGRSGLGAVMGSKRLKAIVVRAASPSSAGTSRGGQAKAPLADASAMNALRAKYQATMTGPFAELFRKYGTAGITADCADLNDSPVKNWTGVGPVDFPTASRISDDAVIRYQEKKYACYRCPLGCGGLVRVAEEPYAVAKGHKPEYETLSSFGILALNDNVESIITANDLCNRYGLDTISAGASIAFAIECYENGILTTADTGGLELTWGNHAAIVTLLHQIGRREALGDLLADGVKRAAERIGKGAAAYAVHVAGQEPGMHDPKYCPGLGTTYQLDATPGRHTQGGAGVGGFENSWKASLGVLPLTADQDYAGKGAFYKRAACMVHVVNAAGLCLFPWYTMDPSNVPEFLTAATGWPLDMEACLKIGERIANVRQAFNSREGFNPLAHPLMGRIVGPPPLPAGATAGVVLDMKTLTGDFLAAMDWDPVTARPRASKLVELGLEDVARDLWQE